MTLGDGELPPFIGYLPPVIDGVLLELRNMSFPDYPPRRGRTSAQLSQERKMAINSLRLHFKEKPHLRSVEILADALENQTPFCLYLRNFGLGARVYPASPDRYDLPQTATLASTMFDYHFQELIQTIISPQIPALCIRNPSGPTGLLPGFIVSDDDWASLARVLVRNAGLIVMYYLTATAGVVEEIELIRREKRQKNTLILIEENSPYEQLNVVANIFEVKQEKLAHTELALDDFPHKIRRKKGAGWKKIKKKLDKMVNRKWDPPKDQDIEVPAEYGPPEQLKKYCSDIATQEFDAAVELIKKENYEEAEDTLTRSIAFAHWGRDTLGRVVTLMTLGRLNIIGFNAKGDAGAYYEMALDICEEIRENSPMAADLYKKIQRELNQLKKEAKKRKKKSKKKK